MNRSAAARRWARQAGNEPISSRWISTSFRSGLSEAEAARLSSWRTSAWAALTSEDLPMPRAPQSRALLAGRPRGKGRGVFPDGAGAGGRGRGRGGGGGRDEGVGGKR